MCKCVKIDCKQKKIYWNGTEDGFVVGHICYIKKRNYLLFYIYFINVLSLKIVKGFYMNVTLPLKKLNNVYLKDRIESKIKLNY